MSDDGPASKNKRMQQRQCFSTGLISRHGLYRMMGDVGLFKTHSSQLIIQYWTRGYMKTSFFTMFSLVFGIGWHVYVRDTKIKQQQTFTPPLTDPPSLHWSPPQHLHQSMPSVTLICWIHAGDAKPFSGDNLEAIITKITFFTFRAHRWARMSHADIIPTVFTTSHLKTKYVLGTYEAGVSGLPVNIGRHFIRKVGRHGTNLSRNHATCLSDGGMNCDQFGLFVACIGKM